MFQYYFYNSVKPEEAPFYGPSQGEDERKWEEALSKKPSPGAIPVLARGFEQVGERIKQQAAAVTALRTRLHEINNSLSLLKDAHELTVASRITEAKRKHIVFTQRTLALATKVQILRNRGYVMDQPEEDLKKKLIELEKQTFDPVLGGRQEEIWARMSGVRERARILQEETEKLGKTIDQQQNGELLTDEDQKALEKVRGPYYESWRVLTMHLSSSKTTTDNSSTSRSGSTIPGTSMTSGRRQNNQGQQSDRSIIQWRLWHVRFIDDLEVTLRKVGRCEIPSSGRMHRRRTTKRCIIIHRHHSAHEGVYRPFLHSYGRLFLADWDHESPLLLGI